MDGSNSAILSKSIGLFYFRFETQLVIHFTSEQGGFHWGLIRHQ